MNWPTCVAAEKIAAHAERQILLIDTQEALLRAASQPPELRGQSLAGLPQRWTAHRERMEQRAPQSRTASTTRGDPLGLAALLRDLAKSSPT